MPPPRPSRTAEFMALFRALESARPPGRRLFHDPFAMAFLRWPLRVVAALARVPVCGPIVPWLIDRRWPGARLSGVARTRLIDDALAAGLADGIGQVVILGAGFDCRAYRLPALRSVRVFEVDRPETLDAKRERLRRRLGALPPHVIYVELDFDRGPAEEALAAAGFDPARRAFFIWEGVTNYLTEQAVDSTLRYVGSCAPGCRLHFTYIHRGLLDGTATFGPTGGLARTLGRVGEVWTFGLDPAEVPGFLPARGLRLVEDVGSVEYRRRYFRSEGGALVGYEFYRAVLAEVGG